MERDIDRQGELLDRFWDTVASGEQRPPPAGIDALTAAIVARLGERTISGDLEAVNHRIRARVSSTAASVAVTARESDAFGIAAQAPARPGAVASDSKRYQLVILAVAAALLAAVGIGFAIFGPARNEPDQIIPAVVVSEATPIPVPTVVETLFEYSIQDERIPPVEIGAGITDFWVATGKSVSWEPYCCSGIVIEHILSGELTFVFQEEIRVVWSDQSVETIPPSTIVILGPGDTLISRIEVPMEAINTGSGPARLLNWTLVTDDPNQEFSGYRVMGWTETAAADVQGVEIPSSEAIVRLQRMLLPPGSALSPAPGQYNFVTKFRTNEAGTPQSNDGFARFDDADVENRSTGPFEIWVLILEVPGSADGTPAPATPTPT